MRLFGVVRVYVSDFADISCVVHVRPLLTRRGEREERDGRWTRSAVIEFSPQTIHPNLELSLRTEIEGEVRRRLRRNEEKKKEEKRRKEKKREVGEERERQGKA